MKFLLVLPLLVFCSVFSHAQANQSVPSVDTVAYAPAILPGNGLAQHDFFYAGEGDQENMYILRGGKVVWSYTHPAKGEISDAVMLSNGNILFAHQFGVTEITPDKKIVWNYDAPPGFEIHTAQPIGNDHVLFVENGKPAKVMVINIKTGAIERQFELQVAHPFRHARLTDKGTLLVAHMDMGLLAEYDVNGKQIWSAPFPGVWSATPLKNGNILVAGNMRRIVSEINHKGETVWQFSGAELPAYKFQGMQTAIRLSNGNTIINNWDGKENGTPVQFIELDKSKNLVWALRSWQEPADLGRSTIIQVLDGDDVPENVRFGDIK
jgi:outer membrane protein assembly factor BamB